MSEFSAIITIITATTAGHLNGMVKSMASPMMMMLSFISNFHDFEATSETPVLESRARLPVPKPLHAPDRMTDARLSLISTHPKIYESNGGMEQAIAFVLGSCRYDLKSDKLRSIYVFSFPLALLL
ncbi:MAG: hypothetical protein PHU12_04205 [Candidatus Aenigmarchaeota archaeon]|nr:hypothetical protein [Candidatus Aenigmarchaeota archaeon]